MKTRILSFLMLLIATSSLGTVNAQFWDGFIYGLINGLSNSAARQTYSNSYNNSSSYKNSSSSSSIEKEYKIEDDGFTWYKLSKYVNGDLKYGIANSNGKTLISPQYDLLYWDDDHKYFCVENNGYDGAVSKSGKVIITPNKYKCIIYIEGTFKYENSSGDWISLNIDNDGNKINKSDYAESSSSSKKKSSSSSDTYVRCDNCGGTGQQLAYGVYGSYSTTCMWCGGSGQIKVQTPQFQFNTDPMPVNTYSGGGYVPMNTNSGSYDNNNTDTKKTNNYFDSYGEKDCPLCHGTGTCQTCNGKGWYYSPYGTGTVTCPNCCSGHVGKCSKCCGTGKTYGKKY